MLNAGHGDNMVTKKHMSKNDLINELFKTGNRESALLLQNWDEMDTIAKSLLKGAEIGNTEEAASKPAPTVMKGDEEKDEMATQSDEASEKRKKFLNSSKGGLNQRVKDEMAAQDGDSGSSVSTKKPKKQDKGASAEALAEYYKKNPPQKNFAQYKDESDKAEAEKRKNIFGSND
jgi:hypothetical protein